MNVMIQDIYITGTNLKKLNPTPIFSMLTGCVERTG